MPVASRVELYAVIRRDAGRSNRWCGARPWSASIKADAVLRAESSGAVLDSLCSGRPREITIAPTIKATMLHARRLPFGRITVEQAGYPVYPGRSSCARRRSFTRGLRAGDVGARRRALRSPPRGRRCDGRWYPSSKKTDQACPPLREGCRIHIPSRNGSPTPCASMTASSIASLLGKFE